VRGIQRGGETVGGPVVDQLHPGGSGDEAARFFHVGLLLEIGGHGDGVGSVNRHPDAGHGGFQAGGVEDLAALVLHLHLFRGVTVWANPADFWETV
jgi:hypothetical protein